MKNFFHFHLSFRSKVTIALIFSILFIAFLSYALVYHVSAESQFQQLRKSLMAVAHTASLLIDADTLKAIPLNKEGMNSEAYQKTMRQLQRVRSANPKVLYVYTMTKTEDPGVWKFIADLDPVVKNKDNQDLTSFPGDLYDVSQSPGIEKALQGPSADEKLTKDEWGVTLSGYAPVRDKNGRAIAVLGIDISAQDVFEMERKLNHRTLIVLAFGILLSVLLGILISRRITEPIRKLQEATKWIAAGELTHKVDIKGHDEIAKLGESFNQMALKLDESRKALHNYFYRMVQSLVRGLEAKDSYTRGHSDRVSEYSQAIALEMGFPREEVELLKEVTQLHDIGKLGIDESILNKIEKLRDDEWEIIKRHPVTGEEILKPLFLEKKLLSVVRNHHERYDGKGYPDGLKGEELDLWVQIVTVADSYDAMTSKRSYRDALNKEVAIAELKKNSGTQFSPQVVEAFLRVL
jgi:putative nucleotidyltransferase with HDIG domain